MENADFSFLEAQLQNTLIPIKPDPMFKTRLKSRISKNKVILEDSSTRSIVFIIVAGGLLLGSLLLWLLRKSD